MSPPRRSGPARPAAAGAGGRRGRAQGLGEGSLSAKYITVFALLVAVPAIGTSAYLLYSSYQDNKRALVRLQQEKAKSVAITIDRYFLDLTKRMQTITGEYLSFTALGSQLDPLLADHPIDAFYVDGDGRKTLAETGGGLRVVKGNHLHDPSTQLAKKAGVYFGPVYAPRPSSDPEARAIEFVAAEFGTAGLGRSDTGANARVQCFQAPVRRA